MFCIQQSFKKFTLPKKNFFNDLPIQPLKKTMGSNTIQLSQFKLPCLYKSHVCEKIQLFIDLL